MLQKIPNGRAWLHDVSEQRAEATSWTLERESNRWRKLHNSELHNLLPATEITIHNL
jgi:hypothetical protein